MSTSNSFLKSKVYSETPPLSGHAESDDKLCLFCYKLVPPSSESLGGNIANICESNSLTVKDFIKVLGMFVDNKLVRIIDWDRLLSFSVKNDKKVYFGFCEDCGVIIQSFCEVYHEMRCLELKLEWKLDSLLKVMRSADRVSLRKKQLKGILKELTDDYEIGGGEWGTNHMRLSLEPDHIYQIQLKRFKRVRQNVVKICSQKLSKSQPRVILEAVPSSPPTPPLTCKNEEADGSDNNHGQLAASDLNLELSRDDFNHLSPTNVVQVNLEADLSDSEASDCEGAPFYLSLKSKQINGKRTSISKRCVNVRTKTTQSRRRRPIIITPKLSPEGNDNRGAKANVGLESKRSSRPRSCTPQTGGDNIKKKKPNQKSKDVMIKCSKCDKTFKSSLHLKFHMKNVHGNLRHVCPQCGKTFKTKDHLNKHLKFHKGSDSWRFQCPMCEKRCATKCKLELHIRAHTKEKTFDCQFCEKQYSHQPNWRKHMKTKHNFGGY